MNKCICQITEQKKTEAKDQNQSSKSEKNILPGDEREFVLRRKSYSRMQFDVQSR